MSQIISLSVLRVCNTINNIRSKRKWALLSRLQLSSFIFEHQPSITSIKSLSIPLSHSLSETQAGSHHFRIRGDDTERSTQTTLFRHTCMCAHVHVGTLPVLPWGQEWDIRCSCSPESDWKRTAPFSLLLDDEDTTVGGVRIIWMLLFVPPPPFCFAAINMHNYPSPSELCKRISLYLFVVKKLTILSVNPSMYCMNMWLNIKQQSCSKRAQLINLHCSSKSYIYVATIFRFKSYFLLLYDTDY